VDEMLAGGLVAEADRLAREGMSRTARQALGYRQVLERGVGEEGAGVRDAIVRATARFARRQESWWRADPRVVWHDAGDPGVAAALVAHFKRALRLP
jgi:tRNA dimethylallyltransferase